MKIHNLFLILLLFLSSSCQNSKNLETANMNALKYMLEDEKKTSILLSFKQKAKDLNMCGGEIDENTYLNMSSVYRLNPGKYLVEILCFLGAYQGNYQYFIYINREKLDILPLELETYEINDSGEITSQKVTAISGIPDYNLGAQTLTILTKYRGLGDCGTLAKYKWQGNEFQLLEYRIKENCDGVYLEPEQYSLIYPL